MRRRPDAKQLADLYDEFGPALYRYGLMIVGDPAAAEDAVQDVFATLSRRRDVSVSAAGPYLRTAVRNACYSVLRARKRSLVETGGNLLEPASEDRDPAERLALEAALRRLPPEQREVVHLKVYEGLTFREIADMTGESINTVAGRYRYAMEKLRTEPRERSMTDEHRELEALLRGYRPASPPAGLRGRVGSLAPERTRDRRFWLAVAGAMLAALLLHTAASSIVTELSPTTRLHDLARLERIERLARTLGGGEAARGAAERLIAREEQWGRLAAADASALESSWNR